MSRRPDEEEPHDQHLYSNEKSTQEKSAREPVGETGEGGDRDQPPAQDAGSKPEPVQREEATGSLPPEPLDAREKEQLSIQWRQRLAGAAQQAMQAGKLGSNLRRLVDHLLQPQLPWRMLLARYITAVSRDDYSYLRPSRREGDAIFPR